jgi:hypothetical protein
VWPRSVGTGEAEKRQFSLTTSNTITLITLTHTHTVPSTVGAHPGGSSQGAELPVARTYASGFMQLREITGKRMIITHLSNHTLGVIITVHDISHLGVKITSL